MRLLIILSSLLIIYFVYGFYISQYEVSVITPHLRKESRGEYHDYRGIINVHSNLSLGSSPGSVIVAAARQLGLDFIMLTDLNTFGQSRSLEGYHGSTLVLVGGKYSYVDSRIIHYSEKKDEIGYSLGDAQTALADFLSQPAKDQRENVLILAHPFMSGFSWSGEIPTGLDGVEILNIKSQSQKAWEKSKASVIWSFLIYPFNPRLSFLRLFSEPTEELNLLDKVSTERKFAGFAGAEASARAIPAEHIPIRFPSYSRSFEIISNHVWLKSELTGNLSSDRQKIIQALKAGQFYLALDILGDPKGFSAIVTEGAKSYLPGAEIRHKSSSQQTLIVTLPSEPRTFYEIVVYRNGEQYAVYNSVSISMPIKEPGTYRVQVRVSPYLPLPDAKRWITWIYSNSFYVN